MSTAFSKPPASPSQAPEAEEYEGVREFLAFGVAEETYALPLERVREILKPAVVTEVPRADSHVLGIISVRGTVTTVIDTRKRLRMPAREVDGQSRILLVQDAQDEVVGMLVDRVLQVYRLTDSEIELAAVMGGETAEYVSGIGRPRSARTLGRRAPTAPAREDDILVLLDPTALLRR